MTKPSTPQDDPAEQISVLRAMIEAIEGQRNDAMNANVHLRAASKVQIELLQKKLKVVEEEKQQLTNALAAATGTT